MATPTKKGKLTANLTSNPAAVRKTRAKYAITSLASAYKKRLDNYSGEVDKIDDEIEQLLDVNPTNTTTTKYELDADKIVDTHINLVVRKAKVIDTLEALKAEYFELFGIAYEYITIDLGLDAE